MVVGKGKRLSAGVVTLNYIWFIRYLIFVINVLKFYLSSSVSRYSIPPLN
jgi:hypothetical protein